MEQESDDGQDYKYLESLYEIKELEASDVNRLREQCMKAVKEILSSSQSTIAVMTAELEVQNETIRTQNETIKALKEEMLEDEVSSKAELESLSATITALRAEVEAYKEKLETARAEVEAEKSKAIEVPRPRLRRGKRCGVSSMLHGSRDIKKNSKSRSDEKIIVKAIQDCKFMSTLDYVQIMEVVDSMHLKVYAKDNFICEEKIKGRELYVIAEGEVQVTMGEKIRGKMGPGKLFGELSVLYNCTRTTTIKALTDVKLWTLEQGNFQAIMIVSGMTRRAEHLDFLQKCPKLQNLSNKNLGKISDILREDVYLKGEYIILQGTPGNTFFIIKQGTVKVTHRHTPSDPEVVLRELKKGDYFGEKALLEASTIRTANVVASDYVSVLAVDREDFNLLIGDFVDTKYEVVKSPSLFNRNSEEASVTPEYAGIALSSLEMVGTLGVGGFGRVVLTKLKSTENMKTFAVKCIAKYDVTEKGEQPHVFSEKEVMMKGRCQFIVRLYKTFRCSKYLYMMMEPCLGGDLHQLLAEHSSFSEEATQFYTACIVEALDYLHGHDVVYRDIKPENVVLDASGYAKLVDFGLAKHIVPGSKTWTFCGSYEYMAPEIIRCKGHDIAADYWSLGIIIFEMLTGSVPFSGGDDIWETYNLIFKGIHNVMFDIKMDKSAVCLIKQLCRECPTERLGYIHGGVQGIKAHKWFGDFEWSLLTTRSMAPPFPSQVSSPTDMRRFSPIYTANRGTSPPSDVTGWDVDFGPLQATPNWGI